MRSGHTLRIAIVVSVCFLAACASPWKDPPNAATRPAATTRPALAIIHGPYLQAPGDTGITVCWMTNRKCVSRVEYAEGDGGKSLTAISAHFGLIDANTTFHAVRLTNLKPGTAYTYRAVSKEIIDQQAYKVVFGGTVQSDPVQFTTLDPKKRRFSFVVLNDRHENVAELREALKKIDWAGVDLVFYNGDMVNYAQTEAQLMRSVVDPSTFAGRIPFVYVRGNHDTRGVLARSLMHYFPTESGRFYYGLNHGGAHFTILDCGEDKRDFDWEYFGLVSFRPYMEEETRWLQGEVSSAAFRDAEFRVAIGHIPPYVDEDAKFAQGEFIARTWCPLLNEGGCDLMLCGHLHVFYEYCAQPPQRDFPLVVNSTDTVIRVDVNGDELQMRALRDDGTEMRKALKIRSSR